MMLTRMTSQRPDGTPIVRLVVSTIFKGRDFWAAVGVGIAVFLALRGAEDVDGVAILAGLAAVSAALATGVWLAERWLSDLLHNSDYGEIVSAVDPELRAATLPFEVVIGAGLAAASSSLLVAAFVGTLGPGWLRALAYAVPAWLVAWAIFGTIGVTRITRRHLRRRSRLQARRKQAERDRRLPPNDAPPAQG